MVDLLKDPVVIKRMMNSFLNEAMKDTKIIKDKSIEVGLAKKDSKKEIK
jgi:hypothetical protein